MGKWWISIISIVLVLVIITAIIIFKTSKDTKIEEPETVKFGDLSFSTSEDTGELIRKATNINVFNDIKLNPFELMQND
ncbi:MAG: hypothetical protein KJ646_04555 [Nanoarchaeota archaeon]|nr:hypothetical protein [Nanoarchaeota archaeon]MBU4116330.1 hypothetical protein [Nanoarchaeota archaeon]